LFTLAVTAAPAAHTATPAQLLRCTAKGIVKVFPYGSIWFDRADLKVNVKGTCSGGPDGAYTVTALGEGGYMGSCADPPPCDDWILRPTVSLSSLTTGKTRTREQEWNSEYYVDGTEFVVNYGGVGIGRIDYLSVNPNCSIPEWVECHNVEIKWSFTYRLLGVGGLWPIL
jgi:hypothetical protein